LTGRSAHAGDSFEDGIYTLEAAYLPSSTHLIDQNFHNRLNY
jgi:hypothetical protein